MSDLMSSATLNEQEMALYKALTETQRHGLWLIELTDVPYWGDLNRKDVSLLIDSGLVTATQEWSGFYRFHMTSLGLKILQFHKEFNILVQ